LTDISEKENIIENARNGDQAAWSVIVRQHQEAVFRMAYLVLRDAARAEDIAQETFIRAFRSLDKFDTARPLRPWLLKIAKNLAYNQQRSLRRYFTAVQRWFETQPTATPSPNDIAMRTDQSATIHAAITNLKQSDQEIIYLRYFLDLSVSECAEVLGIASGTVKSRSSRALSQLRKIIERDDASLQQEVVDER